MTKNSASQGKIRILRLSIALKLGSKQKNYSTQRNAFVIDLFKTLLGLKTCQGFEPPLTLPSATALFQCFVLSLCSNPVNNAILADMLNT